ncbi:MAG: hypothetical protein V1929_13550 [bacterium]
MSATTAEARSAPVGTELEKYSSAVTLSDMEIFVFPDLLYSLVLANILSPRLWAWRDNAWFKDIEKAKPHKRVMRLKQFIIDHYEFNLDLDTWGLTTKEREVERFRPVMDPEILGRSNALFGYEGDKYYFDQDVRRHFGLEKYNTNIIPYWKTETLEAMDAFRFKDGYRTGAGECVSLSTLYAAALFVVCRIPLSDIYLMATPLHSQNFILAGEGYLTNNRRVITRNMWFNGTEQTSKAQRALRNEQITIVANNTGCLHCAYPDATISPDSYERFKTELRAYLRTDITMEILANFLRDNSDLQKCYQLRHEINGKPRYIAAEKVYAYEHNSSYKVSDRTRERLLDELDEDEFFTEPLPNRMFLNKFDDFFKKGHVDVTNPEHVQRLAKELDCQCHRAADVLTRLAQFVRMEPHFPDQAGKKQFQPGPAIELTNEMSREEVFNYLESVRPVNPVADLAFYAYRDLARTDWAPFVKAAMERNPVSIRGSSTLSDEDLIKRLTTWPSESIYDGSRMAQPDEVWNYQRGDGLEKAICLGNIWKERYSDTLTRVESDGHTVNVQRGTVSVTWPTAKGLATSLIL